MSAPQADSAEEDEDEPTCRICFGGTEDGELIEPRGIAVHADKLLVADGGNKRLCLFSLRGELIRTFGPDGPGSSFVHKPQSVALAADAIFCIETKGAALLRKVVHDGANSIVDRSLDGDWHDQ